MRSWRQASVSGQTISELATAVAAIDFADMPTVRSPVGSDRMCCRAAVSPIALRYWPVRTVRADSLRNRAIPKRAKKARAAEPVDPNEGVRVIPLLAARTLRRLAPALSSRAIRAMLDGPWHVRSRASLFPNHDVREPNMAGAMALERR